MTRRRSLYFVAPESVELRDRPLPEPVADQLTVRTEVSAISPGTELLVYRGEAPTDLDTDSTISSLSGSLSYPLQYGYAAVGVVEAVGEAVEDEWLGRRVFAFNPHESHFRATTDEVYPVPESVSPAAATLLPTVETAVNFALDGAPKLGERVVIFGQGLIGLVTTAVLGEFPLDELVTVDYLPERRERSRRLGATHSVAPDEIGDVISLPTEADSEADDEASPPGVDLTYELSGNPVALDDAVSVTGFDGRIVVGSWYGTKTAELELGGRFHRSRIELKSSQVSTIAPELRGRWDTDRRMALAWDLLEDREFDSLITDRYQIGSAQTAYERLATDPGDTLGTLFSYDGTW